MSARHAAARACACALLLALALACGSTPERDGGDATVVKPADLPERHRAVIAAWHKGGAAWELERESVRADPRLARFVVDNLLVEMVKAFERSRLATAGQQAGPFERAQAELVELREHSTAMLAQCLVLRDGVVAFLAADTLQKIGAPASAEVAKLLDDENDETRRRAVELIGKLPPDPSGEPRILEALGARVADDEAWVVRGEAAAALGARGARQAHKGFALGVLARALGDPDETVAVTAATAIGTLGEPRAIPRLADALDAAAAAGRPALVQAIQKSLARLAQDNRPRDARGWRDWWRVHEADFAQPTRPR